MGMEEMDEEMDEDEDEEGLQGLQRLGVVYRGFVNSTKKGNSRYYIYIYIYTLFRKRHGFLSVIFQVQPRLALLPGSD